MDTEKGKIFLDNYYFPHCLQRLRPRDTVRGAFSDTYHLQWKKTESNETFFCTDVNGLYSYCAIKFSYMIGKCKVLIGKDLKDLIVKENSFFYKDQKVMGSILLKILPPQNLFAPFLLYRKKDGSVVNTLCKTCAEALSQKCHHSDEQRSFLGTYMLTEIEFALTLGYQIQQIYESHIYVENAPILRDFIQKLNFYKTAYSDCFNQLNSEHTIESYCDYLNDKMELRDPQFQLKKNQVSFNKSKRNYYKLLCNSLFGKFIQRSDQLDVVFVRSQTELTNIFLSGKIIDDFVCINDNVCMLFVKKDVNKLPPNRKQNVYIGSQITAFARETIYKHLQKLLSLPNYRVYQVECDAIYFSGPSNMRCPLPLSHAVGDFKLEYSTNIQKFFAFGPKHYVINYLDEKGTIQNICKYSGLNLSSELNKAIVDEKLFESFLNDFINSIQSCFTLYHKVTKSNYKCLSFETCMQRFSFQNKISTQRIVDVDDKIFLKTYPYGFK